MTQAQLAAAAGVSQSAIASYEAGHREKPRELFAIAEALQAYATWLDSGKGPWAADVVITKDIGEPIQKFSRVRRDADTGEIPAFFRASPRLAEPSPSYGLTPILAWDHEDDLPEGEFVLIPKLNIHLSAGGGRDQVEIELAESTPLAFRSDWVRKMHLKPKKLAAMTATGRSMEPTIWDGDSLVVDTSQIDVNDGQVYALWYDGGERVKRLYRLPGGGLRIKSDNPEHGVIELGPDYAGHVRIIGRVVHRSGSGGL